MDIRELREAGYLQEVNRRFFHPLGLALEVVQLDDGGYCLGGVWDYRADPNGIYFADAEDGSPNVGTDAAQVAAFIDAEIARRAAPRIALFGAVIQPVEPIEREESA
jgi:hypothetical protein